MGPMPRNAGAGKGQPASPTRQRPVATENNAGQGPLNGLPKPQDGGQEGTSFPRGRAWARATKMILH